MKAEIRDYAEAHFGWHGYSEWLAVYTALAGELKPGWLPVNYYFAEVMPRVNGTYHHIGRRRSMHGFLFGEHAFPDLAYVVNGLVYDPRYRVIPPRHLTDYLSDRTDDIVLKLDNSDSGLGVRIMPARKVTHEQLVAAGDGVVQARITPLGFFEPFNLSALPTLRVATVMTESGPPEVRACYLKFGRSGHGRIMAGDKVRIAVDPETGDMDDRAFMSCWTMVREHPDTGAALVGLKLPLVRECVEVALRMHARWPLPRFVSWDMLPDHQGRVQVMEWEGGVVTFAEATQGPCFADLGWDRMHLSPVASAAVPRVHPLTMGNLMAPTALRTARRQSAAK